ncbi:MAG: class II fructose-bisphosphate aldolase [Lachnospiraceae bacterium]|nr:class II fructose-bisphosphate aldolase [Lachnospiraceae bacterium]
MARTFSEELKYAREHGYAVGAFNIFNYTSAKAVVEAAEERDLPVIIQTSVKTVKFFGAEYLGGMLRDLKAKAKVNMLIHLDHCREQDVARACVDAGWDAIMFDGSKLPYEENIAETRKAADYAHAHGVDIEGELGKIVGVEEDIVVAEGESVTITYDESVDFVERTAIDAYAPGIGTAHGVYKGIPKINFDLVQELGEKMDTPIVIHGGTGLSEETFQRLIKSGGAKVNVSTALKHAYLDNAREFLQDNADVSEPLTYDGFLKEKIKETVGYHMDIFGKGRH